MTAGTLAAFVVAALLLTVTPGLDTMLVLRNVLLGGRAAGFGCAVGVSLGCMVWGAASIGGLTALLTASRVAYDVVRYCGAAYLVWMGASGLLRSIRRREAEPPTSQPGTRTSPLGALRSGLLTNLLNPKVGVFYLSLLPQFLPTQGGTAGWAAALVAIHVGLTVAWASTLVLLANRVRTVLNRARVRRWLDRISASVLIGFGIRVALEGQ